MSFKEHWRGAKLISKEYELSIDVIRTVCDDLGCEFDQIIGVLLELNLISIKQDEEAISSFKGTSIFDNCQCSHINFRTLNSK